MSLHRTLLKMGGGASKKTPKEDDPLVGTKAEPKAEPLVDGDGGAWQDGICDCCTDCGMCCVVACCQSITIGQLYERMVRQGTMTRVHSMITFVSIAFFLIFCNIASDVLELVGRSVSDEGYRPTPLSVTLNTIGIVLSVISCLCGCAIVVTVRRAIRRRDKIRPANCGEQEDLSLIHI